MRKGTIFAAGYILNGEVGLVLYELRPDGSLVAIHDPRTIWHKVVKAAGLELHGPDKVTLHILRHTRATWMMQRGVPIWQAAGFLGMTVKTLESVYGHHSPDHQEQAANV